MSTIDSNGVLVYQDTDSFVPIQTALNLAQSNLSSLIGANPRFRKVANTTARAALVTSIGAVNITPANPLLVWRADASAGKQLELTTDGSTWGYYEVATNTYYLLIAGQPTYDVRMWYKNGVMSVNVQGTAPLAGWVNWAIATLPAGYWPGQVRRVGTLMLDNQYAIGAVSVDPNNGAIGIHNKDSRDTAGPWSGQVTYII